MTACVYCGGGHNDGGSCSMCGAPWNGTVTAWPPPPLTTSVVAASEPIRESRLGRLAFVVVIFIVVGGIFAASFAPDGTPVLIKQVLLLPAIIASIGLFLSLVAMFVFG